jgi:response regulator RpfG family c-di-GMP phosphodiesterase
MSKEDAMAFSDKMNDFLNKGLAGSKELLAKAGAQAQTWSEMGVLKLEILQLKSQTEKESAQLGNAVYAAFVERSVAQISAEEPEFKRHLQRIRELSETIADREERYRRLGGSESDLDSAGGPQEGGGGR